MANVLVNELSLTAIGDAIREKNGETTKYKPGEMANAIVNLPSGGGGDLPEEAFVITGDCQYRFASNGWNWFIDLYGNKIKTKDITNPSNMFTNADKLESIPFELNFKQNTNINMERIFYSSRKLKHIPDMTLSPISYHSMAYLFGYCTAIETPPYVYNAYPDRINSLFYNCNWLSEIPEDYMDTWNFTRMNNYSSANISELFGFCYSLRSIPQKILRKFDDVCISSTYNYFYQSGFTGCYVLDELLNLPVLKVAITSNFFGSSSQGFSNCHRLKNLTFITNEDGSPKTANWKNQTIDLSNEVGYMAVSISTPVDTWDTNYLKTISSKITTQYNSGITLDKVIHNDETYNLLKNDKDSFCVANKNSGTEDYRYSRYNRTSAINTINSLPDTSAFGTNTIKFRGAAGSATDGGAINTLTEEEIAVAAAKGWTVSFV